VQTCGDGRETCDAPTNTVLQGAIAACAAQAATDGAACVAASPSGGAALEQCVQIAQANSATCRDAALQAAAPALASCTQQHVACVKGCPAP
jgi:hypothetical protein